MQEDVSATAYNFCVVSVFSTSEFVRLVIGLFI